MKTLISQNWVAHSFQTKALSTKGTRSLQRQDRASPHFDGRSSIAPATISRTSNEYPRIRTSLAVHECCHMVESNCEFAMQAPQKILVPRRSLFEADYDMIVIRKESPR